MVSETRMQNRVLVALGGNAFAKPGETLTMEGQLQFARVAVAHLAPLLDGNSQLLLTHGNGPQVGHILSRVEASLGKAYSIPLEVCVAESEGELGYVLEQAFHNVLIERGPNRPSPRSHSWLSIPTIPHSIIQRSPLVLTTTAFRPPS
jgi:carbamate kinase